jgi:hypothetical protein
MGSDRDRDKSEAFKVDEMVWCSRSADMAALRFGVLWPVCECLAMGFEATRAPCGVGCRMEGPRDRPPSPSSTLSLELARR